MAQQSSPLPSLGNGSSVCATVGSSSGTNICDQDQVQDSQWLFLNLGSGSGAGRSVTIPEFWGHLTNVVFVAVISFSKSRNHSAPNRVTMEGGRSQPWFLVAKSCLLRSQRSVCQCTIVPSQAVLVPPSHWTLCWTRSQLTVSSKTKHCQLATDVWPDVLTFFGHEEDGSFLLWWLLGCNSKPYFHLLCIRCSFPNFETKSFSNEAN